MPNHLLEYIVAFILVLGLIASVRSLFRTRVWIRCRLARKGPMLKIGFLDGIDASEAPEVHVPGFKVGAPLGRVIIHDNREEAEVELQCENIETDSGNTEFRSLGYITPDGFIYKKKGKRRPEYIGYTARPSSPDVATIFGERSWHTLWLRCRLNAYTGHPAPTPAADGSGAENTKKKKKSSPRSNKTPLATCQFTGFHNSSKDMMPPEARAAAFATIYSRYARKNHREYYNNPAYGWKDTALLSATIYVILYTLLYLVKVVALNEPLITFNLKNNALLVAMFFGIWAVVRAIKIECIERSATIQPRIDLFNKSLGQRTYDICIILGAILILFFSGPQFYGPDLIPMAIVAIVGVVVNMSLRQSNARWKIDDALSSESTDDDGDVQFTIKNPDGSIAVNYVWALDAPTKSGIHAEATLYFNPQYISDLRHINPFFNQRSDKSLRTAVVEMFRYMNDYGSVSAHCRYLARHILNVAAENDLTEEETMQFVLDFVQEPNIVYCPNVNSTAINRLESYIRFPDEVLFDKEADSNSKALLAAALFHFIGRHTLYLYSRRLNHAAIAIEIDSDLLSSSTFSGVDTNISTFDHNRRTYIFCETTGDGLRLGGTMQGMRPSDFEERIELPVSPLDDDGDSVSCTYHWTLDSLRGSHLDGTYTLEFSTDAMAALRQLNPFLTYGRDSNSYEDNIRSIFKYIHTDTARTEKVREIADYIRSEIRSAGLPEIDLVQFALDFCQMPNINYCVDDQSAGINYAKEYMRFPDEVLFDKEGDCDCKSSLTAALFHELGYNVVVLLSSKLSHAGIAIEFKEEWASYLPAEAMTTSLREIGGRRYLYCETTGDGYRIGGIEKGSSIHDFETVVEIPV